MATQKTPVEKGVINICSVLNVIGAGMLFILMLQGAADVAGRYLFNRPIMGTMERGQVLLAMMVFLSWGYTYIMKGHVTVDVLISRLPHRVQIMSNFAATFLSLIFCILIVWRSTVKGLEYLQTGELVYVIHWPLAPFALVAPIGALLLCIVLISEMVQFSRQMKGEG